MGDSAFGWLAQVAESSANYLLEKEAQRQTRIAREVEQASIQQERAYNIALSKTNQTKLLYVAGALGLLLIALRVAKKY